jgi:hypothetical protein
MKSVRLFGRHLVLDGDMWSPRLGVPCRGPQSFGLGRPDPNRDAGAEQNGRVAQDGHRAAREVEAAQAPRLRRQESVEEGEVGRQQIAFDGKMLAAEAVEPSEAFGIKFAREDVAWG